LLGTGSGFVFDQAGNVVTNNHVVADGREYEVVFASGERRLATLRGADVDSDLAVIQVDSLPDGVQPVPWVIPASCKWASLSLPLAIPFGEAGSMSIGVISGLGRTIASQRVVAGWQLLHSPGDPDRRSHQSGQLRRAAAEPERRSDWRKQRHSVYVGGQFGRWLFHSGECRAQHRARAHRRRGVQLSLHWHQHVSAGVYAAPAGGTRTATQRRVFVSGVTEGTPAAEAGLIGHNLEHSFTADGDYIIAINDEPVRSSDELLSYLVFETTVGETVELTVIRDGKEIKLPLTLGERP
jgi:S1-C subfamily serine protease